MCFCFLKSLTIPLHNLFRKKTRERTAQLIARLPSQPAPNCCPIRFTSLILLTKKWKHISLHIAGFSCLTALSQLLEVHFSTCSSLVLTKFKLVILPAPPLEEKPSLLPSPIASSFLISSFLSARALPNVLAQGRHCSHVRRAWLALRIIDMCPIFFGTFEYSSPQ